MINLKVGLDVVFLALPEHAGDGPYRLVFRGCNPQFVALLDVLDLAGQLLGRANQLTRVIRDRVSKSRGNVVSQRIVTIVGVKGVIPPWTVLSRTPPRQIAAFSL